MDTSYKRPEFLNRVDSKVKELSQAINLLQKIDDQLSWAQDFTSFSFISQTLEPIYDSVNNAKESLERELDRLEELISDFNYKKLEFEIENEIKV